MEVTDRSMVPTLLPGDRLFVDPRAFADRLPVPGELVVAPDPELPSRWLVKRVGQVTGGGLAATVELTADHAEGRDSRAFGPVLVSSLIGRAWFRYRPPERAGPI